ncbi:penicillin-binding protein activator LpoB [Aquisalimonas sp.]|uniref:penicillin-binding protein activator LpoB n=1 Tax=Aquisalimonas sp. TaxID=1872621 RepID=UPI0025B82871|nr:penicillin-binding protein activator LpoB [Aquisalimonas sp.]
MKKARTIWIAIIMLFLLAGCATQVDRVGPDEADDISGRWNDRDSRLVSEEMVDDMLQRGWLERHNARRDNNPTVIVGEIRNLSDEHISTNTFIRDIERELINSGRITFVADSGERDALRRERADQEAHALEDTRSLAGMELGADYMLTGTINTIRDVEGRTEVAYYQVNLALTSLTDNTRVWVGQKEIRKVIRRGLFRS